MSEEVNKRLPPAQNVLASVKLIMGAGRKNVKPARVADPEGFVTTTDPVAPLPTMAVIPLEESIVKDFAAMPPKLTEVTPVKLVPIIFTELLVVAEVGVKPLMIGAVCKKPIKLIVPFAVVMATLPLAPVPTMAVIPFEESMVNDFAATPPKLTAVAPVKLVPIIFMLVPLVPELGVKEVMVGPV